MDTDEVEGCLFSPPELAIEPRQPIAMAALRLALGQAAPDLDYIADNALAERANDRRRVPRLTEIPRSQRVRRPMGPGATRGRGRGMSRALHNHRK